ncbi:MAG: CRISPR-associated endonuclease Cas2 [Alphaproteobacteria bacterium]|nr:CRISPR-associated endonuclease Cas2 [Alphaproteobacteria bacterium]
MWMMAMFDLPVLTKAERKEATGFRNLLLDEGFMMMQLSCYIRHASSKEQAEAIAQRIGGKIPVGGKVDILFITDKQYGMIKTYRGSTLVKRSRQPDQLQLF